MPVTKVGVQPHIEVKVICECGKIYCTSCMERCPRCYGLHIVKKLSPNLEIKKRS